MRRSHTIMVIISKETRFSRPLVKDRDKVSIFIKIEGKIIFIN